MRKRPAVLAWLIVSQTLYVVSLLPWLVAAGMAVMAFDAPGSTEMWQPWLFAGTIWSYPFWMLACAIVAWVLYAKNRARGADIATSVPFLALALFALLVFSGG